jgi:3-methyladenine DNA glycosylase Mpg
MEQRPVWRYALHVSPTAVTLAAERQRESAACPTRARAASGPGRYCRMMRSGIEMEKMHFIKSSREVFEKKEEEREKTADHQRVWGGRGGGEWGATVVKVKCDTTLG